MLCHCLFFQCFSLALHAYNTNKSVLFIMLATEVLILSKSREIFAFSRETESSFVEKP
jgi:hypothetical protein